MRLRDFAFFILLLAGDARRSFRIVGSHYDAQQHNNTVANGLDMSAAAQEAFIPRGSGTRVFRRVGTQARALPNRSRQDDLEPHSAAPWFRSSPRRANLDMSLPTGPKKDPEAREAGLNESKFSEKTAKTGVKDVWNSNSNWRWREDLRQWESKREWESRQEKEPEAPGAEAGFLSLTRVSDMNDLSQTFDDKLAVLPKEAAREAKRPLQSNDSGSSASATWWTTKQENKWERSRRFTTQGNIQSVKEAVDAASAGNAEEAERSLADYERTKAELLWYTLAGAVIGTAGIFKGYGIGAGLSFGTGSIASLLYVRLLSKSADALASEDAATLIGGATSNQRILIPVALVLIFSKEKGLVQEKYGIDLNILALLAGFFVNKVASSVQVLGAALKETSDWEKYNDESKK